MLGLNRDTVGFKSGGVSGEKSTVCLVLGCRVDDERGTVAGGF